VNWSPLSFCASSAGSRWSQGCRHRAWPSPFESGARRGHAERPERLQLPHYARYHVALGGTGANRIFRAVYLPLGAPDTVYQFEVPLRLAPALIEINLAGSQFGLTAV
jgi:hypothetical protein